jgi:transposase-like protein
MISNDKRHRRIRKVTEAQSQEFVVMYRQGVSASQIGRQHGITHNTVTYHLRRLGQSIRLKTNSFDEDFFELVDSEQKAYWLGFIAADGCIHEKNRAVVITLSQCDKAHLEMFAQHIQATCPIHNIKNAKRNAYSSLALYSPKTISDLAKCEIHPRKSFTAKTWQGAPELMRHYWRGCFDGDGGLCLTGRGKWRASFCGSEEMVKDFAAFASNVTDSQAKPLCIKYKGGDHWTYATCGRNQVRKLTKELYGGATVALNRKQKLAEEILSERWAHRAPAHNRRVDLNEKELRAAYEAGASTAKLAKEFGAADTVIATAIRRAGGVLRTRREGQTLAAMQKSQS